MSTFIRNIIAHQTAAGSVVRPRLPGKFEAPGFAEPVGPFEPEAEASDGARYTSEEHNVAANVQPPVFQASQHCRLPAASIVENSGWPKRNNPILPLDHSLNRDDNSAVDAGHFANGTLMAAQSMLLPEDSERPGTESEYAGNSFHAKENVENTSLTERANVSAVGHPTPEAPQPFHNNVFQEFAAPQALSPSPNLKSQGALHTAQPAISGIQLLPVPFPPSDNAAAPIIKISIGRIEVRSGSNHHAPQAATKRQAASAQKPKMSLEDYLKNRNAAS